MTKFSSLGKPQTEFSNYVARAMKQESIGVDTYTLNKIQEGERNIRLYPSSMPACSVSTFIRALEFKVARLNWINHKILPLAQCSASLDVYGGMGTLRHSLIQRYVGGLGQVIGNWKCIVDGCGGKRSMTTNNSCPRCKLPMEYEEVGISLWHGTKGSKWKTLSCKIDCLFVDKNDDIWVADYKFKTSDALEPWSKKKLPTRGNTLQVELYCSILRNYFKKSRLRNVKGTILLYCAFDEVFMKNNGAGSKYHEVSKVVSRSTSDRIWKWLNDIQIPQVIRANKLADHVVDKFLLKRKASIKTIVDQDVCQILFDNHDCTHDDNAAPWEKCSVETKRSWVRENALNVLENLRK